MSGMSEERLRGSIIKGLIALYGDGGAVLIERERAEKQAKTDRFEIEIKADNPSQYPQPSGSGPTRLLALTRTRAAVRSALTYARDVQLSRARVLEDALDGLKREDDA